MNLADLGRTITRYGAPLLGWAIAGPAGGAIGQLVAQQFGCDASNPDQIIKAITTDPASAAKLAEIESTQKIELQKLIINSENQKLQSANENTANARQFNLQNNSLFPQILSALIVIGFFACIYFVAMFKQDSQDHDILYMMLGVMGTSFGAVVNFWLGSSSDKTFNMKNGK